MDEMLSATGKNTKKSLADMLVEEKIITPEQSELALHTMAEKGGKLADIFLSLGMVSEEEMAMVRSIQLNLPLIDLKRHTVQPHALAMVPEEMARRYKLIPMDIVNDSLMVVMADPEDVQTIEDIKAQVKRKIEIGLGIRSEIERAIDLNYRSSGAIAQQVSRFAPAVSIRKDTLAETAARTPVAEILNLLLNQAVKDRASDVHIEPQDNRLRIRYRVDGVLHDVHALPLSAHPMLVSRIKILAEMDISENRRPQDGQFTVNIEGNDVDIRVATMETPNGERVTMRILDKTISLFTLAQLGIQPEMLKTYRSLLKSPIGMLLVGGPTGSGKTTTLYAMINELDRQERNIMTIEDPIEYSFLDINQTQVNAKAGLTFATGLRAIMRHDPDVILVGEIRDTETVNTAVQSALTGHLVLSSIHANDAVGILFRLLDLKVDHTSISSTLLAVLAQRMVRKICPNCRTAYNPSEEELDFYKLENEEPAAKFYRGAGCNLCANTGYRGRTGIFELLIMNEEIRTRLRNREDAARIHNQAVAAGMISMRKDALSKVTSGITTINEVMRSVFSLNT